MEQVPKDRRISSMHLDTPSTSPRSNRTLSKRAFEVVLRNWRQFLHTFDDVNAADWNPEAVDTSYPDSEQHEYTYTANSASPQQQLDDSFAYPPSSDSGLNQLQHSNYVSAQPHPWYPEFNSMMHWQPPTRTEELSVPCLPAAELYTNRDVTNVVPPLPLHTMFFDATARYDANEFASSTVEYSQQMHLASAEAPLAPPVDELHNMMRHPHYASSGSSASLSSARSVSTAVTAVTEEAPRLDKTPLLGMYDGPQTCPSLPVDAQRNRESLASFFPCEPEVPEESEREANNTPVLPVTIPSTHQPYTAGTTYIQPPSPYTVVSGRHRCRFNKGRSLQGFDVDSSFNAFTQETPASNIDALSSALIAFT
eukprot:gene11223-17260_t